MFSPDGQWIAYFVPLNTGTQTSSNNFTLKKIQVTGGTPVPLCTTGWPYGASWQDHTIVFGQNSDQVHGIQVVPDTAGTPATLVTVGKDEQATQPRLVTDGKLVLCTVRTGTTGTWDGADLVLQAPGASTRTVLVKGATDGQLIADRLVYYREGTVFGVGIDVGARATRGGPVPIIEGVQSTTAGAGAAVLSVPTTARSCSCRGAASWAPNHGSSSGSIERARRRRFPRRSVPIVTRGFRRTARGSSWWMTPGRPPACSRGIWPARC